MPEQKDGLKPFTVNLRDATREALYELADREDETASHVVRRAIKRELQRHTERRERRDD